MNTAGIAFIAAMYGFGLGILTALGWRLTAGPEESTELSEPHYKFTDCKFLKGSNFDYLCEWPVEDVELAYFGDRWTSRN